jgi:hypothetical protein
VTLTYLANGFDWNAYYIANLSADGTSVDLLAWLTLGSSDDTSFVNADIQAVAGRVNREDAEVQPREGGPLTLQCWPAATTSDIPLEQLQSMTMGSGRALRNRQEELVVTGTRIRRPNLTSVSPITTVNAEQEGLGDLKLYRFPEPVTLAAHSQKQVAFLNRERVRVRFVYWQNVERYHAGDDPEQAVRFMLTRNRTAEGLGVPLPRGGVALFGQGPDRPLLLGEGYVWDRAVGEDVWIWLGRSESVTSVLRLLSRQNGIARYELVVSNDQSGPIAFEGGLDFNNIQANARLGRRDGHPLWSVTVPANGRAVLCFSATGTEDYPRPDTNMAASPCRPHGN